MITVWLVFGTRPEAIKMLPLARALLDHPAFTPVICVTGQHKEMLDQVFSVFGLSADINLNVMKANQTLPELTTAIISRLAAHIESPPAGIARPDHILVHGDTTTCLAGALCAFYQNIPVGHVEAGLRTYDLLSPFPEEANRQMVRVITQMHFPPTIRAKISLLKEGVGDSDVIVTGNTVIDALHWVTGQLDKDPTLAGDTASLVDTLKQDYDNYLLVTGHRRENHGDGFTRICQALRILAEKHPNTAIVYPVHPNPNVFEPVNDALGNIPNIKLIPPQDYAAFIHLLRHAKIVLTDSGGIQEEAPSLGIPVLVMREVTERQEAVEAGTVTLVGTDPERIVGSCDELLTDAAHYQKMSALSNPYGDGKACGRILNALLNYHQQQEQTMENVSC